MSMWDDFKSFISSLPKEKFSSAKMSEKRILQMVVAGRLSAVSASLLSDTLANPTQENLAKLKGKHPSQKISSQA